MEKKFTCKERVRGAYRRRMADVRKLWNLYKERSSVKNRRRRTMERIQAIFRLCPGRNLQQPAARFLPLPDKLWRTV